MELRNINSNDLESVKQAQVAFQETIKQTAKAEVLGSNELLVDTASTNSFNALKASVANSDEPGRAEYVQALKAAIAAGELNISAEDIASAMFEDGTAELLF